MAKWEYKVEKYNSTISATGTIEQLLNGFGRDGWELVSVVPQYASSSNSENQLDDIWIESNAFIFKREK
jgi:hypothetical protein